MSESIRLTPIEIEFYKASKGIIDEIEPQVWIGRYRVDFFVESKGLIIELDGHDYHKTKEQRTNDARRQRELELEGYRVIRFTGSEVFENVNRCVQETLALLNSLPNSFRQTERRSIRLCKRMQALVTCFAQIHEFDLDSEEDGLTLEIDGPFIPLSIEKHGKCSISVKHYFEMGGDIVWDPLIDFLIIPSHGGEFSDWTPVAIEQFANFSPIYRNCIIYDDLCEKPDFEVIDYDLNHKIANIAEDWAIVLINQGWIKESRIKLK